MADTASLVARVKTDGVVTAEKQLDAFSASATNATNATNKLTPAISSADKAAASAAKGGLSKASQIAQALGRQGQDVAVQWQMATDKFAIIGQQVPQFLDAFGPVGAVTGLVVALGAAIGGMLYRSLGDAKSNIDAVEKSAKELDASFQVGKGGVIELSDSLIEMAQNGDAAYSSLVKLAGIKAEQQIQQTTDAIRQQGQAWIDASGAAESTGSTIRDLSKTNGDAAASIASASSAADFLAVKYGVATESARELLSAQSAYNKEATPKNAQAVADALASLAGEAKNGKAELTDQAVVVQKLASALSLATSQLDRATKAQSDNASAASTTTQAYKDQTAQILQQQQIAVLGEKDRVLAIAELDKKAFEERKGVTQQQAAEFAALRDKEAQAEIKSITDRESARLKSQQKTESAANKKTEYDKKRREEEEKRASDYVEKLVRANDTELTLVAKHEQDKLDVIASYRDQGLITAQEYEASRNEIARTARDERLKIAEDEYRAQSENQIAMAEAAAKAEQEKTQKVAATLDALNSIYTTFGGNMGRTYKAMFAASKVYAQKDAIVQQAGAMMKAWNSAPFPANLGAVASTALETMPLIATIATTSFSAREQGGDAMAGRAYNMAEKGKAEVIVPSSNSRVRTAQQMKQIMGESGSNKPASISIVNQTTGRVDQVDQQYDNNNNLILTIREVVSNDLADSNSRISKTRTQTRNMAGFA